MPTSELVGVAEAARLLRCDVRTLHRWIKRGQIKAEKLPGRTAAYILYRDDVEALLSHRDPDALARSTRSKAGAR